MERCIEIIADRKTDVSLTEGETERYKTREAQPMRRRIARAGITKNHGRGTPKAKRRMAAASRRRNRSQ